MRIFLSLLIVLPGLAGTAPAAQAQRQVSKIGDICPMGYVDMLNGNPRFQERCHPFDPSIRGLEDMTNASLQRGR